MEGGDERGIWMLEVAEEWSTHGWLARRVAGGGCNYLGPKNIMFKRGHYVLLLTTGMCTPSSSICFI